MDDLVASMSNYLVISGLVIGALLGALVQRTNFCMANCFTSIKIFGSYLQFKSYMVALFVAMVGTQLLADSGMIDLSRSIYLPQNAPILGYMFGGFIFGIGIVYAGGCASRILCRVGEGNLGALVAVLAFNITAGATLAGYPAYINQDVFRRFTIDTGKAAIPALIGIGNWSFIAVFGVILLVWFIVKRKDDDFIGIKWPLTGLGVGLLIVAGWYVTGHAYSKIMADEFLALDQSVTSAFVPTSLTFAKPNADFFEWIAKGTGISLNFGIATVIGVMLGSVVSALLTKSFHFVVPPNPTAFLQYFIGGLLMGFGAIVSVGCNIGQGLTGLSVISVGGLVTIIFIILGAWTGLWSREKIIGY